MIPLTILLPLPAINFLQQFISSFSSRFSNLIASFLHSILNKYLFLLLLHFRLEHVFINKVISFELNDFFDQLFALKLVQSFLYEFFVSHFSFSVFFLDQLVHPPVDLDFTVLADSLQLGVKCLKQTGDVWQRSQLLHWRRGQWNAVFRGLAGLYSLYWDCRSLNWCDWWLGRICNWGMLAVFWIVPC